MSEQHPNNYKQSETKVELLGVVCVAVFLWCLFSFNGLALVTIKSINGSMVAQLIDLDDIPILRMMVLNALQGWLLLIVFGLAYLVLLIKAVPKGNPLKRATLLLASGLLLSAVVAGFPATEPLPFELAFDPSSWIVLILAIATAMVQMRMLLSMFDHMDKAPAIQQKRSNTFRIGLAYLLATSAIMTYGFSVHVLFWLPSFNGGHDFARFFEPSELISANFVMFSSSVLFASCAAMLATFVWWLLGELGKPISVRVIRSPARVVFREALAIGLIWAVALVGPWQLRLLPEILVDQNWLFPLACLVSVFVAVSPLALLTRIKLNRVFDQLQSSGVAWSSLNAEFIRSAVWPATLWWVYPFLSSRFTDSKDRPGLYRTLLFLAASTLVLFLTIVLMMPDWYELPEWRGLYHATLVPALQIFVSILWAWLIYRVVATLLLSNKSAGFFKPIVMVLSVVMLTTATAPFWVWGGINSNVFARTHEYNSRHEFELSFLHWLFDSNRDGFSEVLKGGDRGSLLPQKHTIAFSLPKKHAALTDQFELVDPNLRSHAMNVVIFYLEGVRPDAISAYGRRSITDKDGMSIPATPHIDSIAADGVRFENARTHYPATWPGWLAINSGRTDFLGELSYSAMQNQANRSSNLYSVLQLSGFDRWCHPNMAPFSQLFVPDVLAQEAWQQTGPDYNSWLSMAESSRGMTRGDKRNARMISFIESIQPDERFFLSEHMNDTHIPWERTSRERARELGFEHGLELYEQDARLPNGIEDDQHARYLQSITRTDAQIGQVIAALKQRGLYENTLIVLIGDHGYQWYEHEHVEHVGFLYDPALRVPLIIKAPEAQRGATVDASVMQVDLLPTVMELLGVASVEAEKTTPLSGISLVPLLAGDSQMAVQAQYEDRDIPLATYFYNQGFIHGFRYKLIFNTAAGTHLLFDLQSDPEEQNNIADERPELLAEMFERYDRHARRSEAYLSGE